jgi:hypothetical protein
MTVSAWSPPNVMAPTSSWQDALRRARFAKAIDLSSMTRFP